MHPLLTSLTLSLNLNPEAFNSSRDSRRSILPSLPALLKIPTVPVMSIPLVKSDVKRPKILRDFVALVEDEFNDVPDVGVWLSNFVNTDARMTP